jgi:hypothetical protein
MRKAEAGVAEVTPALFFGVAFAPVWSAGAAWCRVVP